MARLKSSILVSAISALSVQKNGAAYISRRGAADAGAIFIALYDRKTRATSLLEPAPQSFFAEENSDEDARVFTLVGDNLTDIEISERFDKEAKFDPDFWVVELEGISMEHLGEVVKIV